MTVTYLPATGQVHDEATRQNFEYIESHFFSDTSVPIGELQYNSYTAAATGAVAAGLRTAHAYVSGGMTAVNAGGSRGWELVIPQDGLYRLNWTVRSDVSSDGQYSEMYLCLNGSLALNAALMYSIIQGPATPGYGTHNANVMLLLGAGNTVGALYQAAFVGTVFQGADSGIMSNFCAQFIAAPVTAQF